MRGELGEEIGAVPGLDGVRLDAVESRVQHQGARGRWRFAAVHLDAVHLDALESSSTSSTRPASSTRAVCRGS